MIVKKIPARPMGRNAAVERAAHARNLVDYLRLPEKDSLEKAYMVAYMLEAKLGDTVGERLFHVGGRGFVSTSAAGQCAEMIAVAQAASRSPNPVDHWLLSWRKDELPTPEQIDQVAGLFTEHLGVADQPCIYACHGDTHNRHLHLALNRYDATRQRMVEINDGFNLEAAHQAVALIVERFGWEAEADARYEVANGWPVLTASARAKQAEGSRSIQPKAAAFEIRTGYRSAQRIAQEDALPRIMAATSWSELHAALGAVGIAYEPKGTNGAVLVVDGEGVKASDVHRSITRTRLERQDRLGPFQERDAAVAVETRDEIDDRLTGAFRADEYRQQREEWERWCQAERDRRARERERRVRAASPSEIARAAILGRQPSKTTPKPKQPPPNLESWYYDQNEGLFAERWRNHRHVAPFPAVRGERTPDAMQPQPVGEYLPFPCADGIRYALTERQPTAFLDRGDRIDVIEKDDEALIAAMRLGALNFHGRISLKGSSEFRERAFILAQRHGLGAFLIDPDHVERREAHARSQPAQNISGYAGPLKPDVSTIGRKATSGQDDVRDQPLQQRKGRRLAGGLRFTAARKAHPIEPGSSLAQQAVAIKGSDTPVRSKGFSAATDDWPAGIDPKGRGSERG